MYAVVETGGKQYRVAPGDLVHVEKLAGEPGEGIKFDRVLAVNRDGEMLIGDAAANASVTGVIEKHGRGAKTIVFKFKRKKQYKRTIGHRQYYTAVKIGEIVA
jgi:large subunit ribosomal protein L21